MRIECAAGLALSPWMTPMTELEQSAFFADLDALLAAQDDLLPSNCEWLLEELMAIGSSSPPADARPDNVADDLSGEAGKPSGNKVPGAVDGSAHQYADTHALQPIDPGRPSDRDDALPVRMHLPKWRGNRERPAWRIAADRSGLAPSPADLKVRQPRRVVARIDVVASRKTWDGRKSKKRKDKLSPTEKFSASVWAAVDAKGVAVSLNLGVSREMMLRHHADPKRRMTQNLSKHLAAVGLGDIPYAFVFEITPAKDGGRLHLHGVMDASGLSATQSRLLHEALIGAASAATGSIGGKRQLDVAPLYNPVGWADYLLDDTPRTKRELGLDDPFMISKSMRRMAKTHFELLRSEVLRTTDTSKHEPGSSTRTEAITQQNDRRGFTLRSGYDRKRLSGERDKTSVGGEQRNARHRPNDRQSGVLGLRRSTARSRADLMAA